MGFTIMLFSCTRKTYHIKSSVQKDKDKQGRDEYVVVLHGIYVSALYMNSIAQDLAANGYEVINISYPSTTHTIEDLAKFVDKEIHKYVTDDSRTVNFVGYSLGGIVLRAVLKHHKPYKMGRVVQIGSPNKGSEVADRLENKKFFGWLLGPVLQQLGTKKDAIEQICDPVDYELGVIASKKSRNHIFDSYFSSEHDGLVSLTSALGEGAKESYIMDATHEFMPFNREVINQTTAFIKTGSFIKPKP